MRANHVPRAERLRARISNLESRHERSRKPMGRGNPYWHCTGCGLTDPQLSVDGHGHNCPYAGLEGEIRYYRQQLAEELLKETKQHDM